MAPKPRRAGRDGAAEVLGEAQDRVRLLRTALAETERELKAAAAERDRAVAERGALDEGGSSLKLEPPG